VTRPQSTHRNREFLADSGSHESKNNASDGHAHPEARRSHATSKSGTVAEPQHENDNPAAERNLHPAIPEQKDSAEPGDSCRRFAEESFFHIVVFIALRAAATSSNFAEHLAIGAPE
jgi:hypothetical protein